MNNYGFNSLDNNNPLMQYLRQYIPAQNPEPTEPPRTNISGMVAYEINSKSDIEYIEPDKSGRKQIFVCENENKIYTGRYNHVKKEMDYRAFVDEGDTRLFPKADTTAEMTQIAEALVAVAGKLDTLQKELQELKDSKAESDSGARRPNGQFKKKGEA